MKLKSTVYKNAIEVQHVFFGTKVEQDAWTQMLHDTHAWGLPERTKLDSPLSPLSNEEKASAISSKVVDGITEYTFAKEYEIIVEDITVAYEAEQLAIKTDREQRDLDNADVKGMLTWIKDHPTREAKLKKILKVLIKETLK